MLNSNKQNSTDRKISVLSGRGKKKLDLPVRCVRARGASHQLEHPGKLGLSPSPQPKKKHFCNSQPCSLLGFCHSFPISRSTNFPGRSPSPSLLYVDFNFFSVCVLVCECEWVCVWQILWAEQSGWTGSWWNSWFAGGGECRGGKQREGVVLGCRGTTHCLTSRAPMTCNKKNEPLPYLKKEGKMIINKLQPTSWSESIDQQNLEMFLKRVLKTHMTVTLYFFLLSLF